MDVQTDFKSLFADALKKSVGEDLWTEEMERLIEQPKNSAYGDLSFPCFQLAKHFRKPPQEIAAKLANAIHDPAFEKVEALGPYVNAFFDRKSFGSRVVNRILREKGNYGSWSFGEGKTIVLDFSSPNIAKPFSMGHLRSTVIGSALANICEKAGYRTVKINHLGDWGTQFGKLISAYKRWGSEEIIKANPIPELFRLYVRFHEEEKANPALTEEGRSWFKRLEDGDEEAVRLWKWFRDVSLEEFQRIYRLLEIGFDDYTGESFYNDKMDAIARQLEEKGLLVTSDQAEVVMLEEEGLPPCLIRKSDGATTYATRDLAAGVYRYQTYRFAKALYVVGHEQSVHFKQVFKVLEKMGNPWAKDMVHVPFGLYLKDGKKMSTRKGRVILLEEVLEEAIRQALKNIEAKNPRLENKEEAAKMVGVGAVVFHDLKSHRMNNIEFSLEDMLNFEGETGPYVQYAFARACSVLRKSGEETFAFSGLKDGESWEIVKRLHAFPEKVLQAFNGYDPSVIAKYVLDLAKAFNKYYGAVRILETDEERPSRLALVKAITIVLEEGLRLLGIKAPEQM